MQEVYTRGGHSRIGHFSPDGDFIPSFDGLVLPANPGGLSGPVYYRLNILTGDFGVAEHRSGTFMLGIALDRPEWRFIPDIGGRVRNLRTEYADSAADYIIYNLPASQSQFRDKRR